MPVRIVPLALAASAVLAPAAVAVPSAPRILVSPPEFTAGDRATLLWQASTFDAGALETGYVVHVRNETAGTDLPDIAVPATRTAQEVTGLQDDTAYSFTVVARQKGSDSAVLTAPSTPVRTRMDATPPTGTVSINGGAEFTRDANVTLTLAASDPAPGGGPSSGIGGVQISDNGVFACDRGALITVDCPVTMAGTVPASLGPGGDGVRTLAVRFRDRAQLWSAPFLGNGSAVATDSIILDRVAPSVALSLSTAGDATGVTVTARAGVSDATSGPLADGATWDFGDGTPVATGLAASHRYTQAGTYQGTFRVADRAGNVATHGFSVTVTGVGTGTASTTPTPPGTSSVAAPITTEVIVTPPPVTGPVITTPPPVSTPGSPVSTPARPALRRTPARVTALAVLGATRAGGSLKVRVRMSARGPVRVTVLRPGAKGKTVTVRNAGRVAAAGFTTLTLKAPAAGRYTVKATAGGASRTRALRVLPAARR